MEETPVKEEVLCVVELSNGILSHLEVFTIDQRKLAERTFSEKVRMIDPHFTDEAVRECLDDGYHGKGLITLFYYSAITNVREEIPKKGK